MGKKGAIATILLFLIVVDVASASLWNFRKLVSSDPKEKSNETVSPNPSPAPVSGKGSSKDRPANKTPSLEPAKNVNVKKDKTEANETCEDVSNGQYCKDNSSMVACVQAVDKANKVMVVLIQNDGEDNLKVKINPASLKEDLEVPKHHSEKTNISLNDAGTQIVLNAGNGDCSLLIQPVAKGPIQPVAKGDLSDWIPSYNDLMTPIYGAYFLIVLTIAALGVFACCKLRKRRQDEIPYVELEMGGTREETSINVETAEGWDQGWDDDWDDSKAVKTPGAHHPASVSSNGLTSRSFNRDGWEDWDE